MNLVVSVAQGDDAEGKQVPRSKRRNTPAASSLPNQVWKEGEVLFPSREADRMSDRSVRNAVTRAAEEAGVRPYRIEGGRGEPTEISPHTFQHSIAFRMIRREDKRLEDIMLRLRHANLQTTDEVYGHFRRQ